MSVSIYASQFKRLKRAYPDSELRELATGTCIVLLPHIKLLVGWNLAFTNVWFELPTGYPFIPPARFYVDHRLRKTNGERPKDSSSKAVNNVIWLCFEHRPIWESSRDLLDYVQTIQRRLKII